MTRQTLASVSTADWLQRLAARNDQGPALRPALLKIRLLTWHQKDPVSAAETHCGSGRALGG